MNFIERPKQRASINKALEQDKCTLEDLLTRSLSEGRRTQVKKMIWERDRRDGEIVVGR